VYVDDGDSLQWVETAASGFLGRTGYTGSAGAGNTIELYSNIGSLPVTDVLVGTMAFVTDVSRLYIYNNTWINTAPSTKNFFHIIQIGSFTAPITGTVEYTPINTITLNSLEATIAQFESTNIVFSVMKNGIELQSFIILAGETTLETDFGNNSISTTDVVTMNIVSGSGQDLAVRFIYT
jgi:hypothetical protein